MGNGSKKESKGDIKSHRPLDPSSKSNNFFAFRDKYQSLSEVQDALRNAGLESSNLIVGIDYTKSNTWTGKKTFSGFCLHQLTNVMNPYQQVIHIIGNTLAPFDDDNLIPTYGFGDSTTTDKAVFPFFPDRPCNGFQEVLTRYSEITPNIVLSGPTSFAPLIHEAIRIVKESGNSYHILLIIADGQVSNEKVTADAIVEASKYPISIVMIGVGDGPWTMMNKFDDELPKRKFDNFQFVSFFDLMKNVENPEVTFSVHALQEIPEQFQAIKSLGLLG
jgi:hypothetical protein